MKHEIIYTQSNAFILTDVFENQTYCWHLKKQEILKVKGVGESSGEIHHENGWNKPGEVLFIAAHRPLTDIPTLEGVPLLPVWSETEETIELNYYKELDNRREVARNFTGQVAGRHPDEFGHSEIHHMVRGFLEGYNKAKETYKYTEDDLTAVWNLAFNEGMSLDDEINEPVLFKDVIKSLQQPKRPAYFETVCDCQECGANKTNLSLDMGCENKIATITNSKGQTELVGEYIYE